MKLDLELSNGDIVKLTAVVALASAALFGWMIGSWLRWVAGLALA